MWNEKAMAPGLIPQIQEQRLQPEKPISLEERVSSDLNQMHQAEIKTEKPVDVFDELRAAQAVFHRACHDFERARLAVELANKTLAQISANAQALIESAMMDPMHANQANPQGALKSNGKW